LIYVAFGLPTALSALHGESLSLSGLKRKLNWVSHWLLLPKPGLRSRVVVGNERREVVDNEEKERGKSLMGDFFLAISAFA